MSRSARKRRSDENEVEDARLYPTVTGADNEHSYNEVNFLP